MEKLTLHEILSRGQIANTNKMIMAEVKYKEKPWVIKAIIDNNTVMLMDKKQAQVTEQVSTQLVFIKNAKDFFFADNVSKLEVDEAVEHKGLKSLTNVVIKQFENLIQINDKK
jgi:ribosomal protein S11